MRNGYLLFTLLIVVLLASCQQDLAFHYANNYEANRKINQLILQIEDESPEVRYVLINEITSLIKKYGSPEKEILFLTDYVERNPLDSYNAFYLYNVAVLYEEVKALTFAIHYYERVLNNYPDIKVENNSIHYACIRKLIKYVNNREKNVEYYKLLLSRYLEKSQDELGDIYYALAKNYEELGEWDRAIQEYQKFLRNPGRISVDDPDTYRLIREKVRFYYSDKSWTRIDLDTLIKEVRYFIATKNFRNLIKLESQVSFFTMYWDQKTFDNASSDYFDLGAFLLAGDVWCANDIDENSNASEAFLRTSGWPYVVRTWYLYFKRIDFPADPEFDSRWEWAGIYFGER